MKSRFPFDVMCLALAELELIFEKGHNNYSDHELTERAEKIFDVAKNFDDLYWFIANLKIYLEEVKLYPEKSMFFFQLNWFYLNIENILIKMEPLYFSLLTTPSFSLLL
ncbi:MAG: hypothetical protein ACFFEY_07195 [Candidatus Thorarchaeota archaeon]